MGPIVQPINLQNATQAVDFNSHKYELFTDFKFNTEEELLDHLKESELFGVDSEYSIKSTELVKKFSANMYLFRLNLTL